MLYPQNEKYVQMPIMNPDNQFIEHAWLHAPGGLLLFAVRKPASENRSKLDNEFLNTPVTRLINGINRQFGPERYRYLRHKIHVDHELSSWDQNLIKVCAKRRAQHQNFEEHIRGALRHVDIGMDMEFDGSCQILPEYIGTTISKHVALQKIIEAADYLAKNQSPRKRHMHNRPITALLLDAMGNVLAASANSNAQNQLHHAEVNMVLQHWQRTGELIPPGATIVSSLKPCKMCASLILTACQDANSLRVIAAADDPGRFGRHNLLKSQLEISRSI